ncbi:MAG: YjjI family glycine radical enzyme [Bacillota bacterium]
MNNTLDIIKNGQLTQQQKVIALAREAENDLDVLGMSAREKEYLHSGLICDLAEGAAPYRPRYNLVDFARFMKNGSDFLNLDPPGSLAEATNNLVILYQHIPSVTGMPVYIGDLDKLLEPYITDALKDKETIRLFLTAIDRTLPDSFVHADLGPEETRAGSLILEVEKELANSVPNLSLKYDPEVTPDGFALKAVETGLKVAKPYFVNHQAYSQIFGDDYAIASCYNALPIGGGSQTLVRLNLKAAAAKAEGEKEQFLQYVLPDAAETTLSLMDKRIEFLCEKSPFFSSNFLVQEGLLNKDRYTAMFGIYGMAETVNYLLDGTFDSGSYGNSEGSRELTEQILTELNSILSDHDNEHTPFNKGKFMLHAQSGIGEDTDTSPGCRIPYGEEPSLPEQLNFVAPLHKYFPAGVSDIFTFDQTYESNPGAILDIIRGSFQQGLRLFSFYGADSELVRITGYLVKKSELEKLEQGKQVHKDTAALGRDTLQHQPLAQRKVRSD